MLWLALHLPHFGLEVAERDAGLKPSDTAPRALVRDNCVLMRNAAAAAIGVQVGSTLATAHSLAAEGEPLQHLAELPDHASRRQAFLASVLYRFSSEVSLDGAEAIVMEVGRSLRLFGEFTALEQAATETLAELGHTSVARTAATPGAALALARSGCRALAEVPLATLPIEAKHLERFANMGLHTLGQILKLPRKELGRRFGRALPAYLQRLQGQASDPRDSIQPAARFDESLHLLEPIRGREALTRPMEQLLNELSQWLVSQQLGCAALVWRFVSHRASEVVRVPVRLSKAQQSARAFADISALRLPDVELPEDVLSIGLEAHRLEAWSNQSLELFRTGLTDSHTQANATPTELAELLDQLGARLGARACMHLHRIDQHVPEQAWGVQRAGSSAKAPRAPSQSALRRPLWLFSPPKPVPLDELQLLEGPERIQTSWWADAVSRDYYVAEHVSGARCWAFREPSSKWYLHGYFG